MATGICKALGVTAAFALCAAAVTAVLFGLSAFGVDGRLLGRIDSWPHLAVQIIGRAALAGVIVDLIRHVATMFWPEQPKHRLRPKKIMTRNLR